MKTLRISLALLLILLLPAAALADESLLWTALIGDDGIFYAGSVDGQARGAFLMDLDGSNVRPLGDVDGYTLAASDGVYLLEAYDDAELIFYGADGAELARYDGYFDAATEADGVFYVHHLAITLRDGRLDVRPLFELDSGDAWCIRPITVEDGWLYYYDDRAYGMVSAMENYGSAALCRMDLSSGRKRVVSPEGSRLIGFADGKIIVSRQNIFIYDEEFQDSREVGENPGLYAIDAETLAETKLADIPSDDTVFGNYSVLDDGVIYGVTSMLGDDAVSRAVLKRVTLAGEALPDVAVPVSATLCAVSDGVAYLCAYNTDFTDENYVVDDQILAVDFASEPRVLWHGDARSTLFFSEADPQLIVKDGRIFGFCFDQERDAMALFSLATDGSDMRTLALGHAW